jgi:two-component system, chemotaxis family, protein-glutamate methylesterase/glutaminase
MKAKSVSKDFPVVCVGGSAGGLDAYTRLLRHLPTDMGVAIVIVNHSLPYLESKLEFFLLD